MVRATQLTHPTKTLTDMKFKLGSINTRKRLHCSKNLKPNQKPNMQPIPKMVSKGQSKLQNQHKDTNFNRKLKSEKRDHTVAGHAGNPLTLASTRSPTFHCRRAAAAAAALLVPFLRLGAIGRSRRRYNQMKWKESDLKWMKCQIRSIIERFGTLRNLTLELSGIENRGVTEKESVWRNPNCREREKEEEILLNTQVVLTHREIWVGGVGWGGSYRQGAHGAWAPTIGEVG